MSEPRSFTPLSVWAWAVATERLNAKIAPRRRIARVMEQPFMRTVISRFGPATCVIWKVFLTPPFWRALAFPAGVACPIQPHAPAALWSERYLRTIGHGGQGVDARAA